MVQKSAKNCKSTIYLQKIGKSAKNRQICNDFNVEISIFLKICKNPQMHKAQNIFKCAKDLQIGKKMTKPQKTMNLQTIFKPTIHVNVLENLGNAPKTIFLI
jgi:hypothetical protein